MKELNINQVQDQVKKLRNELEIQLSLLNNYVNDFPMARQLSWSHFLVLISLKFCL